MVVWDIVRSYRAVVCGSRGLAPGGEVNLKPGELSKLSGPQVLEFVQAQVAAERDACAAIAEKELVNAETHGMTTAAVVCQRIAAKIRARGLK